LRKVEGYLIIDIELPNDWDSGKLSRELTPKNKNVQTLITGQNDHSNILSMVGDENIHSFDILFNRLEKIIKVNQEREEKNKLFRVMVKKMEQIFLESDLSQLQKMVLDAPDENNSEPELGQTDNINLSNTEIISDESDDEVLAKINSKKEKISVEA